MRIGVVALQGAVSEHIETIKKTGSEAVAILRPSELQTVDGLIIPGGESTTVGKLMKESGMDKVIVEMVEIGLPVLGTCTGMILLAKEVVKNRIEQYLLKLMDIVVERNAFGRQKESFEMDIDIPVIGTPPFPGVFIRAPWIERIGDNVEALAYCREKVVFARHGNILACAFHPELTSDLRIHHYFTDIVREWKLKQE